MKVNKNKMNKEGLVKNSHLSEKQLFMEIAMSYQNLGARVG